MTAGASRMATLRRVSVDPHLVATSWRETLALWSFAAYKARIPHVGLGLRRRFVNRPTEPTGVAIAAFPTEAEPVKGDRAMALPDFSMRQLLEAGVHFGHQKHRWNPKMAPYLYGVRNNIHIIDLAQTVPMLHRALQAVSDTVAGGGRVLFVGTKRQASDPVAAAAKRCAQYYVNSRWLGGMLTNWKTISNSIQRLRHLDELLSSDVQGLTKKERLTLTRERDKLENALGGIKDMGGIPDLLFVIDTNKEALAIQEARRLNIPVAAIIDSNSDPDGITYPIPGNDDAGRALTLYGDLIARAALDGIMRASGHAGVDLGAQDDVYEEALIEEVPAEEVPAAPAA